MTDLGHGKDLKFVKTIDPSTPLQYSSDPSITLDAQVATKKYVDSIVPAVFQGFEARMSATATDVTGDGTTYNMIFDTEIFDVGSNYNNTTGIFTCPVDGLYEFSWAFRLKDLTASHTTGTLILANTGSTNYLRFLFAGNIGAIRSVGNNYTLAGSVLTRQAASAQMRLELTITGGTKVVDVEAFNVIILPCYFAGYLVREE